jgi:pyrroline-5-carboxylate reductase
MSLNISFIGCGNMAQAIISGLFSSKDNYEIFAYDINVSVFENFKHKSKIKILESINEIQSDIIILSAKPKDIAGICENLDPKNSVIVSIAAGVSLNTISVYLKGYKNLVRVMPNLCAFEGLSTNAIYPNNCVTENSVKIIDDIFKNIGSNIFFKEEKFIDLSTAISGSGPAYFFYFTQLLIESAKNIGLSDSEAKELVLKTFEGSYFVAKKNINQLNDLVKNVSSKGGTTEAAINIMKDNDLANTISKAINAATKRAKEIDDDLKNV